MDLQEHRQEQQIKRAIVQFFNDHLPNIALAEPDNIFQLGLVDSLFALQIVMFVESAFGIACADEDLELRNFCSIENLLRFIVDKRGRLS